MPQQSLICVNETHCLMVALHTAGRQSAQSYHFHTTVVHVKTGSDATWYQQRGHEISCGSVCMCLCVCLYSTVPQCCLSYTQLHHIRLIPPPNPLFDVTWQNEEFLFLNWHQTLASDVILSLILEENKRKRLIMSGRPG